MTQYVCIVCWSNYYFIIFILGLVIQEKGKENYLSQEVCCQYVYCICEYKLQASRKNYKDISKKKTNRKPLLSDKHLKLWHKNRKLEIKMSKFRIKSQNMRQWDKQSKVAALRVIPPIQFAKSEMLIPVWHIIMTSHLMTLTFNLIIMTFHLNSNSSSQNFDFLSHNYDLLAVFFNSRLFFSHFCSSLVEMSFHYNPSERLCIHCGLTYSTFPFMVCVTDLWPLRLYLWDWTCMIPV